MKMQWLPAYPSFIHLYIPEGRSKWAVENDRIVSGAPILAAVLDVVLLLELINIA